MNIEKIEIMTSRSALDEMDWNFDAVPNSELVACCYWEYARESAFIRETLRRYRKEWRCSGDELDDHKRKLWKDMDKIQSIGYAAEVFVKGCGFKPGMVWQSNDPDKPEYRNPYAPPITGSFPGPWQLLSSHERKYRAHVRSDVEQLRIVPIKLAHWGWAKEIARECQQAADEQHEQRKAWEQKYLHKDAKGNFSVESNAPAAREFDPIRPRTRWGVGETLMVDIAWDCFTNDEIVNHFRKWLKVVRPHEIKAPNRKGHKPGDWRAHLTRLAAMRLQSRFSLREILGTWNSLPAAYCRPIQGAKQFKSDKWSDATKWRDARREAGKLFHKLFPFLPRGERPLSLVRQQPGK